MFTGALLLCASIVSSGISSLNTHMFACSIYRSSVFTSLIKVFICCPPSGVAFQNTSPDDLAIFFRLKKINSRNFSENELHEVSERKCYTFLCTTRTLYL